MCVLFLFYLTEEFVDPKSFRVNREFLYHYDADIFKTLDKSAASQTAFFGKDKATRKNIEGEFHRLEALSDAATRHLMLEFQAQVSNEQSAYLSIFLL